MSTGLISLFLPSLAGGGAERVFVELANAFSEDGRPVDLVLASASGPYLAEISDAVRVIDFKAPGVLWAVPRLARYLSRERPSALLSALDHANVGALLARSISMSRARCVISMRSMPRTVYGETGSFRARVLVRLMKATYPFADGIVANSRAVASDLAALLGSDRNISVIYNPVNVTRIEQLSREEVRHPWADPDGPPVVLGVGSLTVLKNFQTLVRAFSAVRSRHECRLVILGEGPERRKLETMLADLRLADDAYLPGFVGNPFAWMRVAKVFVSSSITEGCPNALMQALACGMPAVSTRCAGGAAEILEDGKWGRLVPVGDWEAMAEAIAAALGASDFPRGRSRALDFEQNRIFRQYLELLSPEASTAAAGD